MLETSPQQGKNPGIPACNPLCAYPSDSTAFPEMEEDPGILVPSPHLHSLLLCTRSHFLSRAWVELRHLVSLPLNSYLPDPTHLPELGHPGCQPLSSYLLDPTPLPKLWCNTDVLAFPFPEVPHAVLLVLLPLGPGFNQMGGEGPPRALLEFWRARTQPWGKCLPVLALVILPFGPSWQRNCSLIRVGHWQGLGGSAWMPLASLAVRQTCGWGGGQISQGKLRG